ncbi:MAG: dockerin type I domain-containing protein [Porcipelethomonas sp.]
MIKFGKWKAAVSAVFISAAMAAGMITAQTGSAELFKSYLGDVNTDTIINSEDVVKLSRSLLGTETIEGEIACSLADLNRDDMVNTYDLIILKRCVMGVRECTEFTAGDPDPTEPTEAPTEVPTEEPTTEPVVTTTVPVETTVTTTTVPVTETTEQADFINAPIAEIDSSLPSQGEANLVIFYVDFPDCTYGSAEMTAEQVQSIAFGEENTSDKNYPFESMSAFFDRSSKGSMQLDGKVFRYTTKENRASYDTDKVKLAEECYEAFREQDDFGKYDGDNDGYIDATLFTVPEAAGDDNWWPCAGAFGDPDYTVDGVKVGHIITGNAQIVSLTDYSNFNSSYLHEMGHCMGLPDYYLYSSQDFDSMHGPSGYELMDADAFSDFGAFSKLMLGWYRENQISVYDKSQGSLSFELSNAQSDDGNCVIIPMSDLNGRYASGEYFVIEYATGTGNNDVTSNRRWQETSEGIRIYHVKPDIYDNGWWKYFKYSNGSEFTDSDGDGQSDDDGIRLIRLVNEGEENGAFTSGAVINSSTPGFGWYDENEAEAVDPGVTIKVGELKDGKYTITIE